MNPNELHIINCVTQEIATHLTACEMERSYPSNSADEMDDKIKKHVDAAKVLRDIRNQLENLFSLP